MAILRSELIGVKQDISDEFSLLNPYDVPLITAIGGISKSTVGNTTYDWLEDSMFPKFCTTNNGSAVASTDTSFTITNGADLRVDHIIQPVGSDELIKVTAVAGDVITITRSFAGTTAEGWTDGTIVKIKFIDTNEGANARNSRFRPQETHYNLTQIFDDSIEITGTAEAVSMQNIANVYETEKMKKMVELGWQLENAVIDGIRHAGLNRKMGGIRSRIVTNLTDGSTADITVDMLNSMVQDCKNKGGVKGGRYVFMVGDTQKRKMGDLFSSDIIIPQDSTIRGLVVDSIRTDFGTFGIMVNDNLRPDEVFFVDLNRLKIKPLQTRNWFHTYMGPVGDKITGTIVGEFTNQFKQEKAHARLFNLGM